MPNGGSDCCATCWSNSRNRLPTRLLVEDPTPYHCVIRELRIDGPYWTYCANHHAHRPECDPIPIGPVFVDMGTVGREVWMPSPDGEEIRLHLLALLRGMQELPGPGYGLDGYVERIVIRQLGEFCEVRAVIGLRRVAAFRPKVMLPDSHHHSRDILPGLAAEVLVDIEAALGR